MGVTERDEAKVSRSSRSHPSAELVRARLDQTSNPLAEAVYQMTERLADGEEQRRATLESKAASLLAGTGFSVTVASGLGAGTVLPHPECFPGGGFGLYFPTATLFLAMLCGVGSSLLAVLTLRVTGIQAID